MDDDTSVFVSSSEDRVCARVTLQELTVQRKGLWGQVAMMALGSFGVAKSRVHLMHLESKIEGVWKHGTEWVTAMAGTSFVQGRGQRPGLKWADRRLDRSRTGYGRTALRAEKEGFVDKKERRERRSPRKE
ncbi:hypothetical protein Q7C36_001605 [Tachysurus vachellii]|uniref:Uncharacterized protein n=1 Tax=Tachysurus vachellii TaxID=175792 RepID=A0AA88T841_TACVA|nr:hypothetical protein Q7C36_001605 [Tachysurus vachellii]